MKSSYDNPGTPILVGTIVSESNCEQKSRMCEK